LHGGQGHVGLSSRRAELAQLTGAAADLLVIGGGITGAGIARDAAMRGLRTVLVEQQDLGAGTSSRSSRLVHGGLRYLEQGELRLVFEASRERATLLRIAPHLVRPLAFVFPVHRGDRLPPWRLSAGLWLYDMLAQFRNVRRHRRLGKRELLEAEPTIRERGLLGGARYYDAQCDDARLVLATARSAMAHGARVATYTAVRSLTLRDGRVDGVEVEDVQTGRRGHIAATVVVNATGPWVDRLRRLEDPAAAPLLRPTKGVHLVVPRERLGHRGAITFTSPIDGRVMFILPWGDLSYIGTTDTDTTEPPDTVAATPDDVLYLLRSANALFPGAHLTTDDVRSTWAGLRPLLGGGSNGSGAASSVSREHVIVEGRAGMLTVAGGKLTTYRSMAAEVVNEVVRRIGPALGGRWPDRAPTDTEPLPGGEARDVEGFRQQGLAAGLPSETVEHLLRLYGTEAAGLYNLARAEHALARRLHPDHPAIAAEVVHAVRRELAQTVADVLVRRIRMAYDVADHGASAARRVAWLLGRELGWDERQKAEAVEAYERELASMDQGTG
jgi:glycerol-3-phosphate dehydrogenase